MDRAEPQKEGSAKVIFCGLARVAMVDMILPIGWGTKLGGARSDL